MNRFQVFYQVLEGDVKHWCDSKGVRSPTFCGKRLTGQRVDYLIDAPLCPACHAVRLEREKNDPPDALWRKRLKRRLDRFLKR